MNNLKLTIGMACFDDFDGVFFYDPIDPNVP